MKSNQTKFDWHSFISNHPLFGELKSEDIDFLLDPDTSTHRNFKKNSTIFRAGEISNSFYLIGAGSVNVDLASEDSNATNICSLQKGDYFGEMSAIDNQNGRAATIQATEKCILLEIQSKPFQQLLKTNPELEFKLLSMLTARLRHVNEYLLKSTRLTYDTKFSLLSEKLESQSKVVDASLKASQAVFEQTKIRTDEIINAAERGRSRITWILSTLTAGFTLLLALFSFFGYDKLDLAQKKLISIELTEKSIKATEIEVEKSQNDIEETLKKIIIAKNKVEKVNTTIEKLQQSITESEAAKRILFETLISIFMTQIENKFSIKTDSSSRDSSSDTSKLGSQILEINDKIITIKLFKKILYDIQDSQFFISTHSNDESQQESALHHARISYYSVFLFEYIKSEIEQQNPNSLAIFLSNYLLLINYAMNDELATDNAETFEIRLSKINNASNKFFSVDIKKQLDQGFLEDMKEIDLPENENSMYRKKSIDQILSFSY